MQFYTYSYSYPASAYYPSEIPYYSQVYVSL